MALHTDVGVGGALTGYGAVVERPPGSGSGSPLPAGLRAVVDRSVRAGGRGGVGVAVAAVGVGVGAGRFLIGAGLSCRTARSAGAGRSRPAGTRRTAGPGSPGAGTRGTPGARARSGAAAQRVGRGGVLLIGVLHERGSAGLQRADRGSELSRVRGIPVGTERRRIRALPRRSVVHARGECRIHRREILGGSVELLSPASGADRHQHRRNLQP